MRARGKRLKIAAFLALCAVALCLPAALASCRAKTADSGRIVLIVNGDDVGISEDFTDATLKAWDTGALDSISVVANGHDARRAMGILAARRDIPVGMHYTLVGDWKPLSPGASLRRPDGNMWATAEEAARHVTVEDAMAEFDAQYEKLVQAGIDIRHFDSHVSGYFTRNDIFAAALERARALRIPMMAAYYPGRPKAWRPFLLISSYQGIYGLPDGMEENAGNRASAYWTLISSLRPGVHYLFSHQGMGFTDATPSGDRLIRIDDSAFWTDPATRARISKMGIQRGDIAAVRDSFRKALKRP